MYTYSLEDYLQDILQPWKLVVFALGLLLLLLGVDYYNYPDWDYGICFVMAIPTYLTAGWVSRQFIYRNYYFPLALFLLWFSADCTYVVYWGTFNPDILKSLRWASFAASVPMYLALGLVLMPRGNLRDIIARNLTKK